MSARQVALEEALSRAEQHLSTQPTYPTVLDAALAQAHIAKAQVLADIERNRLLEHIGTMLQRISNFSR